MGCSLIVITTSCIGINLLLAQYITILQWLKILKVVKFKIRIWLQKRNNQKKFGNKIHNLLPIHIKNELTTS